MNGDADLARDDEVNLSRFVLVTDDLAASRIPAPPAVLGQCFEIAGRQALEKLNTGKRFFRLSRGLFLTRLAHRK